MSGIEIPVETYNAVVWDIIDQIDECFDDNDPAKQDFTEFLRDLMGGPNYAQCAYYRGVGTCSFGCSQEPECVTGEPNGGWPTTVTIGPKDEVPA